MKRSGFTLIELLVVIAILAVLAVVVVLTLNPAGLLQESRDANRLQDMATLNNVIGYSLADNANESLGSANTVYISVPDPSATSTAGDQCQGLGLPALPASDTYQCASPTYYRQTNATGWIPINLGSLSFGTPLAELPIDPTNSTSTGLYYSYATNGSQFEVASIFESQKYKLQFGTSPMDPDYPEVNAKGSNLALDPLYNPSGLIGWWPLNEGSGTVAYDQSGNGNNGTWSGLAPYYSSSAKVGTYSGQVASTTNTYLDLTNNFAAYVQATTTVPAASMPNFTLSVWVDKTVSGNGIIFGKEGYNAGILEGAFEFWDSGNGYHSFGYSQPALNTWYMATMSYNQSTQIANCYINGQYVGNINMSGYSFQANSAHLLLGGNVPYMFTGFVDDARIYSRALSTAEIQALYNAEK